MPRINGERLLADLRRITDFGRYETGVHRPHLSPQDVESRHWLCQRMKDAGLEPVIDGVGNVLDHVVVLHARHLRRLLSTYFAHYHQWRCHQALDMDCPESRPIQVRERGAVVEVAEAGGLYRHYERWAA